MAGHRCFSSENTCNCYNYIHDCILVPIHMLVTLYTVSLEDGWGSGMMSPSGSRFKIMPRNSSLICLSSSSPHSVLTLSTQLLKSQSFLRNSDNVNLFLAPQCVIRVLFITLFDDFPSDSELPFDNCKILGGTTNGFEYTVFFKRATSIQ